MFVKTASVNARKDQHFSWKQTLKTRAETSLDEPRAVTVGGLWPVQRCCVRLGACALGSVSYATVTAEKAPEPPRASPSTSKSETRGCCWLPTSCKIAVCFLWEF